MFADRGRKSGSEAVRPAAIAAALIVVFAGCSDADHLNPLDPLSPDFEDVGVVEGLVTDRAFAPLAGVEALLEPLGTTRTTSSDGTFSFGAVAPGDYTLSLTGAGLQPWADTLTVALGKVSGGSYALNGLPAVDDVSIATVHVSRWWPMNDLFRLDVTATASDPDGLADVASVALLVSDPPTSYSLQPLPDPGVFSVSLTESDLGTSLHALQGHEIAVEISDQVGASRVSGPHFISRIIDIVPETTGPSGSQEVPGGSPLLKWPQMAIPFEHTFQVDVYRVDENVATIVFTAADIGAGELSYQVADTLETGTYYWTLSIVDEFQNRSRSKEAGFLVP